MSKEKVILVDENDTQVGLMPKLEAHQKGLLHRAFSVFIFNSNHQLLLQKRAVSKYHSGGLWTNTCCSHPREGEETINAANRRLIEEMGIKTNLRKVFDFIYKAELDNELTENEFDHVYYGVYNEDPILNLDEADDFKWVDMQTLNDDIIKIKMIKVSNIDEVHNGCLLDTGSPHFVKFCTSVNNINVFQSGRELRNNKEISEDGVNINFTEIIDNSSIKVRTYERGVENETLSCGTGVIASVLSAHSKGLVDSNRIKITTLGGELFVSFDFKNVYDNIWLEGPAIEVFKGQI